MMHVHGVFVLTLLGMLQFLVLMIVHLFTLLIINIAFSVLGEGFADNNNDSVAMAEKKILSTLVK